MSMFGYNTLGFGSIAGTSGPPDLDFTVVGNNVERGNGTFSDVAIGTANTHRMVIIQGGEKGAAIAAPTSITIGGEAMTLLRNTNVFIAYKKVPTGTTADIVIGGGGGTFTQQIITLNTVNTAPNQNSITSTTVGSTTGTSTMTTDPVSDDGVFIWGLAHTAGGPQFPVSSLLTSNSNGVTLTINQPVTSDYASTLMGYSVCTTTDSRNVQTRLVQDSGAKTVAQLFSVFTFFQAS